MPVGPLLTLAVLQGVVVLVLPLNLDEEHPVWHPAIGCHDDGVHEEANIRRMATVERDRGMP